jgi:hypothetical protein
MSPVKKENVNDSKFWYKKISLGSFYTINYTLNVFAMNRERAILDTIVVNSTHSIDFSCLDVSHLDFFLFLRQTAEFVKPKA